MAVNTMSDVACDIAIVNHLPNGSECPYIHYHGSTAYESLVPLGYEIPQPQ